MKNMRGGINPWLLGVILLLLFVGWIIWLDATSIDEEDTSQVQKAIQQSK